jgi:endonuclease/exonuclease/phosphatase family metal-dependent hydrolase
LSFERRHAAALLSFNSRNTYQFKEQRMSTSFTAMTWNVENLFPPGVQVSAQKTVTLEDYDAKLAYLTEKILEIQADVLALQEIGGKDVADTRPMDDLQARLNGQYPFKLLSRHPDGRHIRVGFLSRLAFLSHDNIINLAPGELASVPDWWPNPPIIAMGRGALQAEVEPASGIRVRLITAHLKSKLITFPGGRFSPKDEDERARGTGLALLRRAAEATAVRVHLNGLMQPAGTFHTIALGDFNDEPHAATTQMLLGPEDADATSDDQLDYTRLYNLVDSIPRRGDETHNKWFMAEDERFSRITNGRREQIDHLMVSKSLLGPGAELRQDHWKVTEVRSLVSSILNENNTGNPSDRVGKARPDHAPVYARFEL